jgi:hypothetical protein
LRFYLSVLLFDNFFFLLIISLTESNVNAKFDERVKGQ